MKAGKYQKWNNGAAVMLEAPWPCTILCFCSQIVTEQVNAIFPLVSKFKMIGMPLTVQSTVKSKEANKNI